MLIKKSMKGIICPVCGKEFKNASELAEHINSAEDEEHKKWKRNRKIPSGQIPTTPEDLEKMRKKIKKMLEDIYFSK